jgi:hypothetical protein
MSAAIFEICSALADGVRFISLYIFINAAVALLYSIPLWVGFAAFAFYKVMREKSRRPDASPPVA